MFRQEEKQNQDLRRSRESGMTLIELLVVLVILGIIAGIAVGQFGTADDKAKVQATYAEMSTLKTAVTRFKLDMGRLPTQTEGLSVLVDTPNDGGEKWGGPYVEKVGLKDGWNNEYVFRPADEENARYTIISYGADGQAGGEGFNKDLTNHDEK